MTEENEKDPMWKPNDLEPNVPAKVKIDSGKQIATGTGKFGEWNLWPAFVENQKVIKPVTKEVIANYTGKVIFFPSAKLHERLLEITGGTKAGAVIEISLVPKKGQGGFYTTYEAKVLEEGTTPSDSVSYSNTKYIEDFKKMVTNNIITDEKESFMMIGGQPPHSLDKEVLEDLWNVYKEK